MPERSPNESVRDVSIPALGLGTWSMYDRTCQNAVEHALAVGYRHLDTAQMYENESAVGAGVRASSVDRSDVFVTTKLDRGNMAYDDAIASVETSLDRLGMDVVDLLLIHAPSKRVRIAETIEAMNELQTRGAVTHIGVSNFSVEQTETAMAASETPIVTNQVEYHPYNRQDELLAFCLEHDILLTAYSPLARGRVVDDEELSAIGANYDKSASQVTLRWLLQQPNVAAIPKAADVGHIEENFDVFDFELTDAEMDRIFDLDGGLLDRLRRAL